MLNKKDKEVQKCITDMLKKVQWATVKIEDSTSKKIQLKIITNEQNKYKIRFVTINYDYSDSTSEIVESVYNYLSKGRS